MEQQPEVSKRLDDVESLATSPFDPCPEEVEYERRRDAWERGQLAQYSTVEVEVVS